MKKLFLLLAIVAFAACQKEDIAPQKDKATTLKACNTGSIFNINPYWYMNYQTNSGGQCIWYNNINSWGANSGSGFAAMIRGCHWGTCGSNAGIPRSYSSSASTVTWWAQGCSWSNGYDAAYDIWYDYSSNPTGRNATYEMMIWLNWKNTQPIAQNYDAQGQAIPYATNVWIAGYSWKVYHRDNTFSFLMDNKQGWIGGFNVKAFSDYAISKGWMPSNIGYLTSVQAGWENLWGGDYQTYSFGVAP